MKVDISVDDKALLLNSFTQEIIGNVAAALVQSLRGVEPSWKALVIRVEKE
jgi:hypothetical protein